VEAERVKIVGPLNASLKAANDFFRAPAERLKQIEGIIKARLLDFQQAQERKRAEEQRQRDLEAQRERQRLETIAREAREKEAAAQRLRDEEARIAREAAEAEQRRLAAAAAAAKAAGDAEAQTKAEREAAERREADAAAQRQRDADAEAARLTAEAKAAAVVAPVAQAETPKIKGISTRKVWRFEIIDPEAINPAFMLPDEKKIGATVKAMGKDAGRVVGAGVRIYSEEIMASARA
jgi:colicin import membrane protein